MKFGLNFFPSFRASDCSTAEYFAQCLRLAERADQLGFNSIKTVEHYFFDYGGHSPNPIVFLSAVAARTQRIRPITGAVIPAFNHPVKLAAELAVLDNISNRSEEHTSELQSRLHLVCRLLLEKKKKTQKKPDKYEAANDRPTTNRN